MDDVAWDDVDGREVDGRDVDWDAVDAAGPDVATMEGGTRHDARLERRTEAPRRGPGTALEGIVTVLAIALVGVVSAAVHASAM